MLIYKWILLTVLVLPSSLAVACPGPICVIPSGNVVTVPGKNQTFVCVQLISEINTQLQNVLWLLNGSALENYGLGNVITELGPRGSGILTFTNLSLENNHTTIQCQGSLQSGVTHQSATEGVLLLQGALSEVGSLQITPDPCSPTLSLTWTPPFTLDIPGVDPDITGYCVDVIDSTSSSILSSQCGINRTEFRYSTLLTRAVFRVTPVNYAGNGTQLNISHSSLPPRIEGMNTTLCASGLFAHTISMSTPLCNTGGEVAILDTDTGESTQLLGSDVSVQGNAISFKLVANRRYNITVMAFSNACASIPYTLSTYDVRSCIASFTASNKIAVTTDYFKHSTASGALFSFVFITDSGDVDFSRSFLLALDRNTSHNHTLPFDLYPGHYRVYVYDIEYDGTLHNEEGYPAVSNELSVGQNICQSLLLLHYQQSTCHINTSSNIIIALCSTDVCPMVTDIQMIVQPTNVSEVHKLYVNQSMDLHTPMTVSVERDGEYQVSIFAIREGMGILGSGVKFSRQVMVHTQDKEESTAGSQPEHTTAIAGNAFSISACAYVASKITTTALGIALGVTSLIAAIMTGVITVLCCKLRFLGSTNARQKSTQIPLAAIPEGDTKFPAGMATQQLYEEIRDVDPSYPNIVAPESTPGTPAAPIHHVEYEDVKPAVGVAESGGAYHFTLCSAYGVPLEGASDN